MNNTERALLAQLKLRELGIEAALDPIDGVLALDAADVNSLVSLLTKSWVELSRAKKIAVEILESVSRTNLKSHTEIEVVLALVAGNPVFDVDTGSSGNDDIVIVSEGEGEDAVRALFVAHFDLKEWPEEWTIRRLELPK